MSMRENSGSSPPSTSTQEPEQNSARRAVLPSLFFSSFAICPAGIVVTLLLVDIGRTFGAPVGLTGQVQTLSSSFAVITALLMGALSARFKHKSLLLVGLLLISISVLGCSLALNFGMILVMYSITGVGLAVAQPMTMALVGELFPPDRRAKGLGWINAGATISYLIGTPTIGFIAGLGGWRLAFLSYTLPISVLGLLLAAKGLPSPSSADQNKTVERKGDYLAGFKGVLSNRSALSCLLSAALVVASFQAIAFYGTSFYRERFLVSTTLASIIVSIGATCATLSTLVSYRFINRFGRKSVTVMCATITGLLITSYTNMPSLWSSLASRFVASTFWGVFITASTSLALEQAPSFRGVMMSLNSAAWNVGGALGAAVGGFVLLLHDYELVGIVLGVMMVIAAAIYYLFVIDPTRS